MGADDAGEPDAFLEEGEDGRAGDGVGLGAETGNFLLDMGFGPQLRGVDAGAIEGAAWIGQGIGADAGEAVRRPLLA